MLRTNNHMNQVFPELDLPQLKNYAERWAKKYPTIQIDQIILHRVPTHGQDSFMAKFGGSWPTTKYSVIFEFSNCEELSNKYIWEKIKSLASLQKIVRDNDTLQDIIKGTYRHLHGLIERGLNPYFLNADAECFKFIREINGIKGNKKVHPFLESGFFRRVYTERIPRGQNLNGNNFRSEWNFGAAHIGDNYIETHLKNVPYIILYPIGQIESKQVNINGEDEIKNGFIFMGGYWKIIFNGKQINLKNNERIRYIIYLLNNPDVEMHVRELVRLVKGIGPDVNQYYNKMSQENLEKEFLYSAESQIENLSADEKNNLEKIAHEIWDDYKNNPDDKDIREKWLHTKRYMANENGIIIHESKEGLKFDRKTRRLNHSENEKARLNVFKHISNAIKDIGEKNKGNMPDLSKHLKKNIDTGIKCIYKSDPINPIKWHIIW